LENNEWVVEKFEVSGYGCIVDHSNALKTIRMPKLAKDKELYLKSRLMQPFQRLNDIVKSESGLLRISNYTNQVSFLIKLT
jgi:hypothetical protein